jgi:hypothetical protein
MFWGTGSAPGFLAILGYLAFVCGAVLCGLSFACSALVNDEFARFAAA